MSRTVHEQVLPSRDADGMELAPPPSDSSHTAADPVQQVIYPYGVGIDTHSKFIAVCVLRHVGGEVRRKEQSFDTGWHSMVKAHAWVMHQLKDLATKATLRYCIESTGTYHMPVLQAWGGVPSVVNPMLAGPTRRKTDVLDARLLAHHSITGMWPESFLPTEEAQQLRVLWAERREGVRLATRASNRINNTILRFGHTFGAEFSMRSTAAEGLLDDLLEGRMTGFTHVNPAGLPEAVRPVIRGLMAQLQDGKNHAKQAMTACTNFIKARDWPIASGVISGTQLLTLLQSVPGVGETTAVAWLAEVTDPRRFRDSKQVAAYAGCDPSLKVSAGKVTSFQRRAGNSRLHHALSYAAQSLLRQPREAIGMWGKSIAGRHKKGGYKKAVGAISRRIAIGLWYVHSKGEPFSYAGYNFDLSPKVTDEALKTLLNKKQIELTAALKLTGTQSLITAYHRGQLATISGIGAKTIQNIKQYIVDHRIKDSFVPANKPVHDKRRVYVLKPRAQMIRAPKQTQQKGS